MKTLLLKDANDAAALLTQGEIVALPTETVYGLAGNATDPNIVKKIFEAKERPSFDPLIVHISDSYLQAPSPIEMLVKENVLSESILSWKNRAQIEQTMKYFWPGPLTMILPKGNKIPSEVTSNQDTVGIRCPKHPLFQKVLSQLSFPLAAPSANRFGRISPTTASHVRSELDGRIAGILDGGACEVGLESTIIKITENSITLLRPGKIAAGELEKAFGLPLSQSPSLMQAHAESGVTPGMLDEHYAPRKPLYLIPVPFDHPSAPALLALLPEASSATAAFLGMTSFSSSIPRDPRQLCRILSAKNDPVEIGQQLFAGLRELDENDKVSVIFADSPSSTNEGLGASIFDRLKRASRNKPTSPS